MVFVSCELFHEDFGGFVTLNADVEAVFGVGYANTLEVVVNCGDGCVVIHDLLDTQTRIVVFDDLAVGVELFCAIVDLEVTADDYSSAL